MDLDDDDLCKWILYANEKCGNILTQSSLFFVETMLNLLEEGREITLNNRNKLQNIADSLQEKLSKKEK